MNWEHTTASDTLTRGRKGQYGEGRKKCRAQGEIDVRPPFSRKIARVGVMVIRVRVELLRGRTARRKKKTHKVSSRMTHQTLDAMPTPFPFHVPLRNVCRHNLSRFNRNLARDVRIDDELPSQTPTCDPGTQMAFSTIVPQSSPASTVFAPPMSVSVSLAVPPLPPPAAELKAPKDRFTYCFNGQQQHD